MRKSRRINGSALIICHVNCGVYCVVYVSNSFDRAKHWDFHQVLFKHRESQG